MVYYHLALVYLRRCETEKEGCGQALRYVEKACGCVLKAVRVLGAYTAIVVFSFAVRPACSAPSAHYRSSFPVM